MSKISTRMVCVNGKHPKTIVNPLNPSIKIQILICCPYTFSIEVVGRIWEVSIRFILCDHVLYSHDHSV